MKKFSLASLIALFFVGPIAFADVGEFTSSFEESSASERLKSLVGERDSKRALAWDRALRVELINDSEQADYMALMRNVLRRKETKKQSTYYQPILLRLANQNLEKALEIAQLANLDPSESSIHDTLSLSLKYQSNQNLRKKRGRLSPPLEGPIKTPFGIEILKGTRTEIRHTGLSFDVPKGSKVTTIGRGLVVFARDFDGFGKTVIIDHGTEFHSLYAHLSQIDVVQGEEIRSGTIIGESGSIDEEPELYFEIRLGGQAVDPEPFLSL